MVGADQTEKRET